MSISCSESEDVTPTTQCSATLPRQLTSALGLKLEVRATYSGLLLASIEGVGRPKICIYIYIYSFGFLT